MSVAMSPEAPQWVPTTTPASWGPQNASNSKLPSSASTYESNGTVYFVHKGSGEPGVKSKLSEREAVTPSGQRIFILPRAVNAEFHVPMEDLEAVPKQ